MELKKNINKEYQNILFVDPLGDDEVRGFNLGICCLSGVLRKHNKRVSVLDFVNHRDGDPKERLKRSVDSLKPDIIGFSIQNMSYLFSKQLISCLRTFYSGPVLLGGAEVTAIKETILNKIPEADIAVIGEAEDTLPALLEQMTPGNDISNVDGIVWKKDNEIIINKERKVIKDLDSLPYPDLEVYGIHQLDRYLIMTTRGCPFSCSFCFNLSRLWRKRSPENVLAEIKLAVTKYKIKMLQFADSAFNINPERVIEICDLMIKEEINIQWMAYGIRADTITEPMAQKMKEAGCKRLYIGIESMDHEVFKEIGKGEKIEQIREGIRIAKKYGLEIYGYLVVGLPKDTFKKTLRSFDEAEKLDLDFLAIASAVPYTGTRLHQWVKENARELYDSTKVSSLGTRYDNIAYETDDFPYEKRVLARKLIYLKGGSYVNPRQGKLKYWCEKLYLLIRYDWQNIHKRIIRATKFRAGVKKGNLDTVLQNNSAQLARIPDGTWGLSDKDKLIAKSGYISLQLK